MTDETPSLEALRLALSDVDALIANHPKVKKPGVGAPPGPRQGPLLRSSVALVYTAWEVYAEESLIWVVEQWVKKKEPTQLPGSLRDWVGQSVSNPWVLADGGWGAEVVRQVTIELRGDGAKIFGLNTASPGNVIELQRQLLGEAPLKAVKWQGKTNSAVRKDLAQLVSIRGEIVHKGETPGALNLAGVQSWKEFVLRLATKLDQELINLV